MNCRYARPCVSTERESTRNFVDTGLVTTAFKIGGQEYLRHFNSLFVGNKATRKRQNIGIVVLTGKRCQFGFPAQSGTDSLVFVNR